jgi:hypothetical protein
MITTSNELFSLLFSLHAFFPNVPTMQVSGLLYTSQLVITLGEVTGRKIYVETEYVCVLRDVGAND